MRPLLGDLSNPESRAVNEVLDFNSHLVKGEPAQEDQRPTKAYTFEYKVKHDQKNIHFSHKEASNQGRTEGQYKVALPDGRVQTVRYFADKTGFHPEIIYDKQV
jgi:hypothetical protein